MYYFLDKTVSIFFSVKLKSKTFELKMPIRGVWDSGFPEGFSRIRDFQDKYQINEMEYLSNQPQKWLQKQKIAFKLQKNKW